MAEGQLNLGTLYDINKQAMAQFEPLPPTELYTEIRKIADDISDYNYYMLLCKERGDYTIFKINTVFKEKIFKELYETLFPRGKVIAIDKVEDSEDPVYEIWIRDFETDENVLYMLFECSNFIIEV